MLDLLLQGRWFMIPLMGCSVVTLAVVLDRWLYLRSASKEIENLLPKINDLIEKEDIDGLEELCRKCSCLLTTVFSAGVKKYKQIMDEPNLDFVQNEINKMMEDASILNTSDLERRLPLLSTVGNVSPLFGFAGTVTGMISAFAEIAVTANPDAQTVAVGIQEALVTTATGLIIAIPAVIGYNYFTHWIEQINLETEETANNLVDMLVMSVVHKRTPKSPGSSPVQGVDNHEDAQAAKA